MPQDARRQKLEVHGQADGLEALFLKGTMIGIADDLLDRHDEFYGIISQRTVRRTGYQMQGNVARFVLRQLYTSVLSPPLSDVTVTPIAIATDDTSAMAESD